jgi:hypothetical protein
LRYANLSGSDLSHTKLVSTELTDANCKDAKFEGAVGLGERFKQKWSITDAATATKKEEPVSVDSPDKPKKEKKEKKEKKAE